VGGHTDSVGGREYNIDLSKRRAEALVEFLVENGVERSRLQPEGYGFDKPVPGMGAKAAANRRVEIVKID
jgi:OmpA-OmpF porin, OOP family